MKAKILILLLILGVVFIGSSCDFGGGVGGTAGDIVGTWEADVNLGVGDSVSRKITAEITSDTIQFNIEGLEESPVYSYSYDSASSSMTIEGVIVSCPLINGTMTMTGLTGLDYFKDYMFVPQFTKV